MNIVDQFHKAARQDPNHIAIVYKRKSISFLALQNLVLRRADGLQKAGVTKGDNIMLMIPFSLEMYVHILALFHLGARVVLVDAIKNKPGVVQAYNKADCKGIITLPIIRFLRFFWFAKPLWKSFIVTNKGEVLRQKACQQTETDSALITFTSGTTGNPKAADRTHGFLNIQLNTLVQEMQIKPTDVHITSLPVVLMCNLAVGATSIIPPKPKKKKEWSFILSFIKPNMATASPAHFTTFLANLNAQSFNKVFIGGATILPHFVRKITQVVEARRIHFAYGSTEAEPIALVDVSTYLNYLPNENGLCVGVPHPNIQVRIGQIEDGKITDLSQAEVGEILVAGRHVLNHYFKDDAAFKANKIVEGDTVWHRTGDLGYFTNELLFFYGRKKYAWMEEEKVVSPLVYEKYLSECCAKAEGTWLHIGGKNIVFATGIKMNQLQMVNAGFQYQIHDFLILNKLPKDNRHLSRIDYEKLISYYLSRRV